MMSIFSGKHMTKIENPAMMMSIVMIVLIYDNMRGMMFIAMLIGSSGFIKSILVMISLQYYEKETYMMYDKSALGINVSWDESGCLISSC